LELHSKRRITIAAIKIEAIVKAFITLDKTHIRAHQGTGKIIIDLLFRHGKKVKIHTGTATGSGKPKWVYVIRAFFVGLDLQSTLPQSSGQTDCNGCLAGRLIGSGDEEMAHIRML